jgi:hypothetical protein
MHSNGPNDIGWLLKLPTRSRNAPISRDGFLSLPTLDESGLQHVPSLRKTLFFEVGRE